jgi:hypothetical protein
VPCRPGWQVGISERRNLCRPGGASPCEMGICEETDKLKTCRHEGNAKPKNGAHHV